MLSPLLNAKAVKCLMHPFWVFSPARSTTLGDQVAINTFPEPIISVQVSRNLKVPRLYLRLCRTHVHHENVRDVDHTCKPYSPIGEISAGRKRRHDRHLAATKILSLAACMQKGPSPNLARPNHIRQVNTAMSNELRVAAYPHV